MLKILERYPEIEEEDIKASLEYAASVLGKEEVYIKISNYFSLHRRLITLGW